MTEIKKKAAATKHGPEDLEEQQLDAVTGGAGYLKLDDIDGESLVIDGTSLTQKVNTGGTRLPVGSIRATKIF